MLDEQANVLAGVHVDAKTHGMEAVVKDKLALVRNER